MRAKTKCVFNGIECFVDFLKYPNGTNAIQLTEKESGNPYITVSTYISGIKLLDDEAVIKNYAKNNGVFEALVEQGIIKPTGRYAGSPLRPIAKIARAN